jgi:hypothetical protein
MPIINLNPRTNTPMPVNRWRRWAVVVTMVLLTPLATAEKCDVDIPAVTGLIGEKWRAMGGYSSPLGGPRGNDYQVHDGRRQDFQNGQIASSPAQGERMLVWCYPEGDHVRFGWGPTNPFSYDFFIVRWGQGGMVPVPTDQQTDINSGGTEGFFDVRIPLDQIGSDGFHAGFTFIVEGADGSFLGGSEAKQGWTIPVSVRA